jgi:hypothetical protein
MGEDQANKTEVLMELRKNNFQSLVDAITPENLDKKGQLLEDAIYKLLLYVPQSFRDSLVDRSYDCYRSSDNPTAMICHPSAEAHFNIMGGYKHLLPMKSYDPHKYEPPQEDPMHRFNLSRYTKSIFDPTRSQYLTRGLTPPYEDAKSKSYGLNGYPSGDARNIIHLLKDTLEDQNKGAQCFAASYSEIHEELYELVKAAAEYWPLKVERKTLGVDFYNRTKRQAAAYYQKQQLKKKTRGLKQS